MLTAAGDLALVADRPQFEGLPLLSVSLTVVVLVLMPIIWRRPQLRAWWFCLFGVDVGQLVTNWLVPVSGFGLSGPMRISEEKKTFVSFRSVSFIYVNT